MSDSDLSSIEMIEFTESDNVSKLKRSLRHISKGHDMVSTIDPRITSGAAASRQIQTQKRLRKEPAGFSNYTHHRLRFSPPDKMMAESDIICKSRELNNFTFYHEGTNAICSLVPLDHCRGIVTDLTRSLRGCGTVSSDMQVSLTTLDRVFVVPDDRFLCSVILDTPSGQYRLGRPHPKYSNTFETFVAPYRFAAMICHYALNHQDFDLASFLRETSMTGHIRDLAFMARGIVRSFPRLSRAIFVSSGQRCDIEKQRAAIERSKLFRSLEKLASMPLDIRLSTIVNICKRTEPKPRPTRTSALTIAYPVMLPVIPKKLTEEGPEAKCSNGDVVRIGDHVAIVVKIDGRNQLIIGSIRKLSTQNETEVHAHIHRMQKSVLGGAEEYFFLHGSCQDVTMKNVLHKVQYLCRFVMEPGKTWRDPIVSPSHPCDSCRTKMSSFSYLEGAFEWDQEVFHKNDVVLLNIEEPAATWRIGIIYQKPRCRSPTDKISVRFLGQWSDLQDAPVSERNRLYFRDEWSTVPVMDILGKGVLNSGICGDERYPSFICHERLPLGLKPSLGSLVPMSRKQSCKQCALTITKKVQERGMFKQTIRPPSVDLYSGGGGSVLGAMRHFNVQHAVDHDIASCNTLEANFSDLTVHCCTVSDYSERSGDELVFDPRDNGVPWLWQRERLHPPQTRGEVSLIIAGPPCQGHSGANIHPRPDDERNQELFITLAEVDRCRPDLFILENVPGMKRDKAAQDKDNCVDEDGSCVNFAKQAVQRLIAMGYQARIAILDSRSYGSPQRRLRLFILAARTGIPLPTFPVPTHTNPECEATYFPVDPKSPYFFVAKGRPGTALNSAVTAIDALSDLPEFDYANADRYLPPSRSRHKRKCFPADRSPVGFQQPVSYATSPKNDFQRRCRSTTGLVSDHFTPHRSRRELAIIFTSPEPGKEPPELQGTERRTHPNGSVRTLLTSSRPGGKATGPIHWNQQRTFTVAERKRIQGFPDDYMLLGSVEEKDRMIGNAINVDLISVVCQHIKEEVYFNFWLTHGKPGHDEFWNAWRKVHPVD